MDYTVEPELAELFGSSQTTRSRIALEDDRPTSQLFGYRETRKACTEHEDINVLDGAEAMGRLNG